MKTTEKLFSIQEELKKYEKIVNPVWQEVLDAEVTKYPILIYSTIPMEAGVFIMDRADAPGPWSVSLSSLEEFSVKGLVREDKVKEFIKVYKDPTQYYCTFVISDLGAQFLFLPNNKSKK